jgi:hypothetical protein
MLASRPAAAAAAAAVAAVPLRRALAAVSSSCRPAPFGGAHSSQKLHAQAAPPPPLRRGQRAIMAAGSLGITDLSGFMERVRECNNGVGAAAQLLPFVVAGTTVGHLLPRSAGGRRWGPPLRRASG